MLRPGDSRQRMAMTLKTAYGDGLLSQATLVRRLDALFGSRLIDPMSLVGDLSTRSPRRAGGDLVARARQLVHRLWWGEALPPPTLLALDWSGEPDELLVGRDSGCDIVLTDPTVSRQHARLKFRDVGWVLQDLDSSNGTIINDTRVVRCRLRPGDSIVMGDQRLVVD